MKKRRIAAFSLAVLLIICLVPAVEAPADSSVTFISINDTVPPELINVVYYSGGREYLPCWVFANYGLGIYYSYLSSCKTAMLHNSATEVFFDLRDGSTFDDDKFMYSYPAILVGDVVYLPLSFVSAFFGTFSVSHFENDGGNVIRLKTSSAVLDDSEFSSAALSLMKTYAASWKAANTPASEETEKAEDKPVPTPLPTPLPPQTHAPEPEKKTFEDVSVKAGFTGLPSDELIDVLGDNFGNVTFFISSDDIKNDPERVRRLVSEGGIIGMNAVSPEDTEIFPELLFEAALCDTYLAYVAEIPEADDREEESFLESLDDLLSGLGYAICSPVSVIGGNGTSPYAVTSYLELYEREISFICPASDINSAEIVLNYLEAGKYNIEPYRDISPKL